MIIVTGATGFIGSCLVKKLNEEGYRDIIAVDDFSEEEKNKNLSDKIVSKKIHRDVFSGWLTENHRYVQIVFHIGARTDTTETDENIFNKLGEIVKDRFIKEDFYCLYEILFKRFQAVDGLLLFDDINLTLL